MKILKVRSDHGGEFEMSHLKLFVKNMELSMNSLLLELHNKMGLERERMEIYKKWQEPSFIKIILLNISRQKQ